VIAAVEVYPLIPTFQNGAPITNLSALKALDAQVLTVLDFQGGLDRFGILTPWTSKWTSLQEY
jgi:hypothetical protein